LERLADEDQVSAYQFCFCVATILTRLALQNNLEYSERACRRLCELNGNPLARECCGSALSNQVESLLSVAKAEFPIRRLLLKSGVLAGIARDCCEEALSTAPKFIVSITPEEWATQSQDQVRAVLAFYVIPRLEGEADYNDGEEEFFVDVLSHISAGSPDVLRRSVQDLSNHFPSMHFFDSKLAVPEMMDPNLIAQIALQWIKMPDETKKLHYQATFSRDNSFSTRMQSKHRFENPNS